jgi:tetratricopeptide (TPR) repeat protein
MRGFLKMTQEDEIEKLQNELYQNPQSGKFIRLAELYLSKEMNNEAVQLTQQSLKFHPQSVSGHLLLGRSLRKINKLTEALEPLNKAVTLASDNWRAWLEIAEIQVELKSAKKAQMAYKKVLFLNPTHPQARRAVAKLEVATADEYEEDLFSMQSLPESELQVNSLAEAHLNQSVQQWPAASDSLLRVLSYIDALIVRHENKKAIDLLNECANKHGTHPEIESRRLKLSVFEKADFIKPKSLAEMSQSKREIINEKKILVLQELLHRIECIKSETLST